jgi:hypothetical protein
MAADPVLLICDWKSSCVQIHVQFPQLLERARDECRESVPHRFHTRKVKKLWLDITRYITSKSKARQEKVKASFRTLIERVDWIVALAGDFREKFRSSSHLELSAVALELAAYLPSMHTVTEPVIERHKKLFGERPVVLAADKGFCPEKSKYEELAKLVANLAIPRRM